MLLLEKQYLGNNSPQFRLYLFSAVQREEQFINRRQKAVLWLLGNGHLGSYNVCCFRSSEGKRLWKLREGGKKQNSQWAGLLRRRTLFEFHKGFENRGNGALLFVL